MIWCCCCSCKWRF